MKKLMFILLFSLLFSSTVWSAGVLDMTADTSPTSDDIIYVINDPAGTPGDRKVTLGNAITKAHGLTGVGNILKLDTGNIFAPTGFVIITPTTGGILYGTGTGVYTPLAKGTANQILQINAGVTAPVWTSTLGVTGTRLTKGWFTDLEITNAPTINGAAWTTILSPLTGSSSLVTTGALSAGSLASGFTPVTVPLGGTGASTYALNGILYGNAANPIGVTAIGTAGQILKVGADPFVPAWTSVLAGITVTGGTNGKAAVWVTDNTMCTANGVPIACCTGSGTGTCVGLTSATNLTDVTPLTSANISDTAYDATSWDTVTTIAPSKNAVRDKIETLAPLNSPALVTPSLGAATATSLLATGIVDGTAPIVITATSAGYTLGATYKSGYTFTNPVAAAATFYITLPAAAAGLQYCVGNGAAKTGILRVTAVGDDQIDLDGTLGTAAGWATATAVAGNFGCFIGIDGATWKAIPTKGTWTIAGP